MPKKSQYPRLRTYIKRGKSGQVWVSYWYDNRGTGKPDIPLGKDYAQALKLWDEIHNERPRLVGTIEQAFRLWETEALPKYESDETKKGYTRNLKMMRGFFGPQPWEAVTVPVLKGYLDKRSAKTQGNRELSVLSIVWNFARVKGLTALPWPAHGMERAKWKNEEGARDIEVSDAVFEAIHKHAREELKDALDLASATGLRVKDVVRAQITDQRGDFLEIRAGKTGKRVKFDIRQSAILPAMLKRRKENKALHLFLLTKPTGGQVTLRSLQRSFTIARAAAAKEVPEAADVWLRDMRKRAAQLAEDVDEASKLLQHSSKAVTRKHYTQGDKVRPVR